MIRRWKRWDGLGTGTSELYIQYHFVPCLWRQPPDLQVVQMSGCSVGVRWVATLHLTKERQLLHQQTQTGDMGGGGVWPGVDTAEVIPSRLSTLPTLSLLSTVIICINSNNTAIVSTNYNVCHNAVSSHYC